MNATIRRTAVIAVLLIAFALIASPVAAATFYQGGSTQSIRSFTKVNPGSMSVYTSSQPQYLYSKYATLNNYLSSGSLNVNTNMITIPSMAIGNHDWDTIFAAPSLPSCCGCG